MFNASDWFKKIAIVRSEVKKEYFPTEDSYMSEKECIARSEVVKQELESLNIPTSIIIADNNLVENLTSLKPDLCINFVDSIRGNMSLCSVIPGIFDYLNIPYVGANTLCLSINCNKYLTKTLLEAWEIPTPQYQLFRSAEQNLDYELRFPLILKLNEEHGAVGISEKSVVTNPAELKTQLEWLIKTYKQTVLAEEFIEDGTELTGLVLESQRVNIYLSERIYTPNTNKFKLLTFETQYAEDFGKTDTIKYKSFVDKVGNIRDDIKLAFEILKMDDFGRFDVMLDKYGNHFLIDCNSNPSLGPKEPVAGIARSNGHSFQEVILRILQRNILDRESKKLTKPDGDSE